MELTSRNNKKNKSPINFSTMIYGKVPPQAIELEEWVLGACMVDRTSIDAVIEIIRPECFYRESHQVIFSAMLGLQGKGMIVDILSVVEELKRIEKLEQVGGGVFITRLTNSVVSTAALEQHARIILQKFIQRELIRISGEIIGDAYEDSTDVFDLLDETETKIFGITNNFLKKDFETAGNAIAKVVNRVDQLMTNEHEMTGVPSGFPSIDRITYGWQPTDFIILAARPSVGKTAIALNFARNAALHPIKPIPVGFFSLEMSTSQLIQRIVSAESEINLEQIMRGKLNPNEYTQFMGKGVRRLESAPIFIDDTAALNIFEFRAKARRMVNKHGVGLIIIDYLQLMSGSGEKGQNREQQISTISRNLKALAKELNIPIIALSQLSRDVEKRTGEKKMPQLSDLRESGAIEQDADMVIFIYRPEYYDIQNNEYGEAVSGQTDIKFAKHRNGSVGDIVSLKAKLNIQKFYDPSDSAMDGWKPIANFRPIGRDITEPKSFDDGFKDDKPF